MREQINMILIMVQKVYYYTNKIGFNPFNSILDKSVIWN